MAKGWPWGISSAVLNVWSWIVRQWKMKCVADRHHAVALRPVRSQPEAVFAVATTLRYQVETGSISVSYVVLVEVRQYWVRQYPHT